FATYWFWWGKPLNVQCAVPVPKSPTRDQQRPEPGTAWKNVRHAITVIFAMPSTILHFLLDGIKFAVDTVNDRGLCGAIKHGTIEIARTLGRRILDPFWFLIDSLVCAPLPD